MYVHMNVNAVIVSVVCVNEVRMRMFLVLCVSV